MVIEIHRCTVGIIKVSLLTESLLNFSHILAPSLERTVRKIHTVCVSGFMKPVRCLVFHALKLATCAFKLKIHAIELLILCKS